MEEYLKKIPEELKNLIEKVHEVSVKENIKAYLVGGFVRDLMLGAENLDMDVTVEGSGILFAEKLAARVRASFTSHAKFGTATICPKPHLRIDVASARQETYKTPGSLPQVKSSSLKDDLWRRDFTINAMAISLCPGSYGRLMDFFGGRKDLKAKRLRVLHDLSFKDDPTRIFRAVRFEQRYGFKIEPHTLKLLKDALESGVLESVSPQRIRHELIIILKEPSPVRYIKRLGRLGILKRLFNISGCNDALLDGCRRQIAWFSRNYPHRRRLDCWLIYLMAILDKLESPRLRKICARLNLRKGEEKRLLSLKKTGRRFIAQLTASRLKPARIYEMLQPLSYEALILLRAKHKSRVFRKRLADFLEIYNQMCLYISGEDLCNLGLEPGPKYRRIFAGVLSAKLNGEVKTREEELQLIRRLIN